MTNIFDDINSPRFTFDVVCVDSDGNEKWRESIKNTVMVAGKNDLINKYFIGTGYTAAWFMGLVGGSATIVNTDTLASHSGWTELTSYTGSRQPVTFGTTSAGSNTALAVSFSITGTMTVAGAFLSSVSSGTSGILYNAALFSTARSVLSGDTLSVTATLSVA